MEKNYYGNLVTMTYEILHGDTPKEEYEFYKSFATKDMNILEPLCGSGRFLIPMIDDGYQMYGMDASVEMLDQLVNKRANANVVCATMEDYSSEILFDYIFIPAGSFSLFTQQASVITVLEKLYSLLKPSGLFVFDALNYSEKENEDLDYKERVRVKTNEGYDLVLKSKNNFDESKSVQYSPGIYELYDGDSLLASETMDFQIKLYKYAELDPILKDIGFDVVNVFGSFAKENANSKSKQYLYVCQKK